MSPFKSKKFYLIIFLIFIFGGIYFLPTIISKTVAKKWLLQVIEARSQGDFSVTSIHLRWFGPQKIIKADFSNEEVVLSIHSASIDIPLWSLWKLKNSPLNILFNINANTNINNLKLQIKKDNILISNVNIVSSVDEKIQYHFSGHVEKDDQKGAFSCLLERKERSYLINANFDHIPSDVLQFIPGWDPDLDYSVIVGKTFILNVKGNLDLTYTGPITINALSDNVRMQADLFVHDRILTLLNPFKGYFYISQEMAKKLFSPDLITGFSSKDPIFLQIDPAGFIFPLNNRQKIEIAKGVLSIGQVKLQNGPTFSMIMGILSKNFIGTNSMTVWFAPQFFSVKNGYMFLERMDFLVDSRFQLCSWGQIDLMKEYLNMKLGITSYALREAFHIDGLPDDYVLTMSMKGPLNKIKVNPKKATEKIAAMIAAQQAKDNINPLFGTFLDLIQKDQKAEDIPPPRKPFPWN